jgi:hypothetical protein
MMMPILPVAAVVAVAGISAAFGLERDLHLYKFCSEAKEHILDHVVRSDTKNVLSNFGRKMSISQMPREARQLIGIFMSDFDNDLRRGVNLQPSAIFELQAISVSHGNRLGKVEQDIFALIPNQANTSSMSRIEIESDRASRFFRRPIPGESMKGSAMSGITVNGSVMRSHSHIST